VSPLCALILVSCLVTEDAPNGLIGMGQRLVDLMLVCLPRGCGSNGIFCPITPGMMAWQESGHSDFVTCAPGRC